ncbi:hypothetical protein ACPXCG_03410 [Gordonia sp. DT218]|uniref:hypothetical protein n=1 Tax=Gordonia sp. DT218 TaxID=3416659 RepID=UPI003CF62D57
MSGFDIETDGAELAAAGRGLNAGSIVLIEAVRILDDCTVFLRRPESEYARLDVYTVRREQWVLGFSTKNRLVRVLGPCSWMALTGQDLMENMPPEANIGIDVQDDHGFFVPAALIAARSFTGTWGR